jgi:hypothetical protein
MGHSSVSMKLLTSLQQQSEDVSRSSRNASISSETVKMMVSESSTVRPANVKSKSKIRLTFSMVSAVLKSMAFKCLCFVVMYQ